LVLDYSIKARNHCQANNLI